MDIREELGKIRRQLAQIIDGFICSGNITAKGDIESHARLRAANGAANQAVIGGGSDYVFIDNRNAADTMQNNIVLYSDRSTTSKAMYSHGTKLIYEKGDSFAFGDGGSAFVSGFLNDNKTVLIDIPLDKPLADDVTGVTISGFRANIVNNGTRILGTGANAGSAAPSAITARLLRRNAINLTLTIAQTSSPIGVVGVHVPYGTIKFT